jgi:hypothetical protein
VREVSPDRAEPRFDIDLSYGKQGELQIGDFLKWIASGNGRVEVKRKRILDLELYVEQEKDPGCTGHYVPGGINETTAQLWCFVVGDTGIHVGIPTAILREAVAWPSSRPKECSRGSCPTRGMLVNFGMLLRRLKQLHEGH